MAVGPFGTGKVTDYTGVINEVPLTKNKITAMNLFEPERLTVNTAIIDVDSYGIKVLGTHERRSPAKRIDHGATQQFPIIVPHIKMEDYIYPEDVEDKRLPGSQEQDRLTRVRAKRLNILSGDLDLTHEYFRLSALKGKTKDGNGKTLFDAYSVMGKTQKAVSFDMTSTSGLKKQLLEVKRYIEENNKTGGQIRGIECICSPSWFDALIENPEVAEAYGNTVNIANPLREDVRDSFVFMGIRFTEYAGSVTLESGSTESFIEDKVAYFFPTGVRGMFKEYYSPKGEMGYVGTEGLLKYASEYSDPEGEWLKLKAESNALMINTRPEMVVKFTNSASA